MRKPTLSKTINLEASEHNNQFFEPHSGLILKPSKDIPIGKGYIKGGYLHMHPHDFYKFAFSTWDLTDAIEASVEVAKYIVDEQIDKHIFKNEYTIGDIVSISINSQTKYLETVQK